MKTIIEPFRIKSVEPIRMTTEKERDLLLKAADYNLFALHADDVLIDLLTDSGTSAMSAQQWAAVMSGDESYAGSSSFYAFQTAVQNLMPFKHIIPTHQGRAAERILASVIGRPGKRVPNNTHFDTTRANFEAQGMLADNFLIPEALESDLDYPFKGNMNVAKLDAYLAEHHKNVPLVMITITNNAGGGQPVSLENIAQTKQICKKYHKKLFIDGCRFAENAYFIKLREPGYENESITNIVRKVFSYADGMTMSAKKDTFANIGGWLAVNDDEMAEQFRNQLIVSEGFPTYGGLAGRDLAAIAQGLTEIVDEDYLHYRIRTSQYLGDALSQLGIPVLKPIGGHAVYIDAKKMLPEIALLNFPGQAICIELYRIGGIRSCELGSLAFGSQYEGKQVTAPMELVRLALPRRVYTQSHIDYVIECCAELVKRKKDLRGVEIIWQPKTLRHFTAKMKLLA